MKTNEKAYKAENDREKVAKPANRNVGRAASPAHTETKPSPAATQSKKNSVPITSRRSQASKRTGTKKASVIALLRRAGGATLPDLMKATGWQAHSVRGFISGTLKKRMSLRVKSSKTAGAERIYQIRG